MKIKNYIYLFLITVAVLLICTYPPVNGTSQIIVPNVNKEPIDVIIQSSREDSLAFVKAADENTKYQGILIAEFKKQKKEIEALKRENLQLRRALTKSNANNDSLVVITKKKKPFWKTIFNKKNNSSF